MSRILTHPEAQLTVFYYNFDDWNPYDPYLVLDGGPSKLNLVLGRTPDMKVPHERMAPKFMASSAPVWNSNIVMDVVRQTTKFNGSYIIPSLVNVNSAALANSQIAFTILNETYGVQIDGLSSFQKVSTSTYSIERTEVLKLSVKSNENLIFKDGYTSANVTVTTTTLSVAFQIIIHVVSTKPIHPGSAGSALFCDGRRHALAKDFSFGRTTQSPKFT
ncbi:hypothetical protein HDU97_005704, partial [Phlyctochytrium planicorne]